MIYCHVKSMPCWLSCLPYKKKLNYPIFAAMAKKVKKTTAKTKGNSKKAAAQGWKQEKEMKIDLKALARDERTWKITGAVSLLVATFLLISFLSYFFTWKEDQSFFISPNGGMSDLSDGKNVSNLLGKLGAFISHFFIYKLFGIASLLICTFFFVVGVNLLFNRKVFSIWRNLKYVTVGLLVLSASLAFILGGGIGDLNVGGEVGNMISDWMKSTFGSFGTAAILLVLALAYFIWQFNPAFNLPQKKGTLAPVEEDKEEDLTGPEEEEDGEKLIITVPKKNIGKMTEKIQEEEPVHQFELNIKDEPIESSEPMIEKEIISDILHTHEDELEKEEEPVPFVPKKNTRVERSMLEDLPLEIKSVPDKIDEEEETDAVKAVENLPPYEPTLDLRDYKYPSLNLLETHGSEKIVQDANELENNKNQIIATLKNYSIEIQKISATVGPTVTLYEIVPAAGVRISRIKNLEDDIALSLAALGIRIIAPIPGKGTIGIEVPNVKKTVVSMKTLLASDKFQHNQFSLPIAIGKKIDNDNYIVDLASMPHLLMAGATGQGKSVGLNAILVSLLYKKHPSQMKFVLIDPKKVELSVYRHIEKHFLAKLPGEEDAIITDTKKVVHTLNALCIEMDNRYDLLKEAGARNIKEYNEKFIKRKLNPQKGHQYPPFILLVIEEFADFIITY